LEFVVDNVVVSVTLADCSVQTFRAGGKGGQNQNKRESGVRVIHRPSNARGESRSEREQLANRKKAFRRMTETVEFKTWLLQQAGFREQMSDEAIRTYRLVETD
jgi:protein subunit release factor B